MNNNIRFKTIAGKVNKIPEFYTIFAGKMPDCIIRQRDRGQAEAICLRPRPNLWGQGRGRASRPLWPRGLNITAFNLCQGHHTTELCAAILRNQHHSNNLRAQVPRRPITLLYIGCSHTAEAGRRTTYVEQVQLSASSDAVTRDQLRVAQQLLFAERLINQRVRRADLFLDDPTNITAMNRSSADVHVFTY